MYSNKEQKGIQTGPQFSNPLRRAMTSAWSRSLMFLSWTRNELVKTWLGAQWWLETASEENDDEEETSMMTARLMISKRMERGDVVDVADALGEREATWTMAWQQLNLSQLGNTWESRGGDQHWCGQHQQCIYLDRFSRANRESTVLTLQIHCS